MINAAYYRKLVRKTRKRSITESFFVISKMSAFIMRATARSLKTKSSRVVYILGSVSKIRSIFIIFHFLVICIFAHPEISHWFMEDDQKVQLLREGPVYEINHMVSFFSRCSKGMALLNDVFHPKYMAPKIISTE